MDAAFRGREERRSPAMFKGFRWALLALITGCAEDVGYLRVIAPELVLDDRPVPLQLEGVPEGSGEPKWSVYPTGVAVLDANSGELKCVGDGDALVQVVVDSNSSSAAVSCRRDARLVAEQQLTLSRGKSTDLTIQLRNGAGDRLPDVPLEITVDHPAIVQVRERTLTGLLSGSTQLTVTAGSLRQTIAITVVEPLDPAAVYVSDGQRLLAIDIHGRTRDLMAVPANSDRFFVDIGNQRASYILDGQRWENHLDGHASTPLLTDCTECKAPPPLLRGQLLDEEKVVLVDAGDVLIAENVATATEIARFPIGSTVFCQADTFVWTEGDLLKSRMVGQPIPEAGLPGLKPVALAHDGSFALVRSANGVYGSLKLGTPLDASNARILEWPDLKGELQMVKSFTTTASR